MFDITRPGTSGWKSAKMLLGAGNIPRKYGLKYGTNVPPSVGSWRSPIDTMWAFPVMWMLVNKNPMNTIVGHGMSWKITTTSKRWPFCVDDQRLTMKSEPLQRGCFQSPLDSSPSTRMVPYTCTANDKIPSLHILKRSYDCKVNLNILYV